MSTTIPPPDRRLRVVLTVVVAAAVVGFFTGTRRAPTRQGYREAAEERAAEGVARAPRQADMEATRYAMRRHDELVALSVLAKSPRDVRDPVTRNESAYEADIAARAQRRAYDGAPPTIPHAIDQHGAPSCMTCHEHGMSVNGRIARPMSHEAFSSCTQCHVTREGPVPAQDRLASSMSEESTFAGLAPPLHGGRAFVASPPQLPHRSFMRERCSSCHGVWASGLATTHPERQSCTQCHALSSSLDQGPISTLAELSAPGAVR